MHCEVRTRNVCVCAGTGRCGVYILQACSRVFPDTSSPSHLVVVLHLAPASPSKSCTHLRLSLPSNISLTNLASARPCPEFTLHLSAERRGQAEVSCLRELHNLSLDRLPEAILKRRLLLAFHVVPFEQPPCVSYQPRPYVCGGCHRHRETCFQLEPQAPDLTIHTAPMFWLLNLRAVSTLIRMPSALTLSAILPANAFSAGSGSTFRTAFAHAIRLTNAVHNAERYAFSSDFVDSAALIGVLGCHVHHHIFVDHAWSPGWCRCLGQKSISNAGTLHGLFHDAPRTPRLTR